jgi:hypothetical protein
VDVLTIVFAITATATYMLPDPSERAVLLSICLAAVTFGVCWWIARANWAVLSMAVRSFEALYIIWNGILFAVGFIPDVRNAGFPIHTCVVVSIVHILAAFAFSIADSFHFSRRLKITGCALYVGLHAFIFVRHDVLDPIAWKGMVFFSTEVDNETYALQSGPIRRSSNVTLMIFAAKVLKNMLLSDAAVIVKRNVRFVTEGRELDERLAKEGRPGELEQDFALPVADQH